MSTFFIVNYLGFTSIKDIYYLTNADEIRSYILLHGFDFMELLPWTNSNINKALTNLENNEIVCSSFYAKELINTNGQVIDKKIVVLFTNFRIICTGNNTIVFDYIKDIIIFNKKQNSVFLINIGDYIIRCYDSHNKNDEIKRIVLALINSKKRSNKLKIEKEYKQKNIDRMSADLKKFIKRMILSNFESVDVQTIFESVEDNYEIYFDDIPKENTEKFYRVYINKKLDELKTDIQKLKDDTKDSLKKNIAEDKIIEDLIEKYEIDKYGAIKYIAKAKNMISNDIEKEKSDQRKKYSKEIALKYEFDEEKILQDVKKKYDISEKRIKKDIKELKKESEDLFYKEAEDLLITNDGNIFKSIKDLMNKFKITKDEAKTIVDKVYDSMTNKPKDEEPVKTVYIERQPEVKPKTTSELLREIVPYNGPKCPNCGCTDISKIGNISRAVSIGIWGLASSKIGKTQKCNKCGHTW